MPVLLSRPKLQGTTYQKYKNGPYVTPTSRPLYVYIKLNLRRQQAKRLLGYAPAWSQQEALDICLHSMMAELRNPKAPKPKLRPLDPTSAGPVPVFTKEEVARHAKRESAWIIVDGKVRGSELDPTQHAISRHEMIPTFVP